MVALILFVIFAAIGYFALRRAQTARKVGRKSWLVLFPVSVIFGVLALLQLLTLIA